MSLVLQKAHSVDKQLLMILPYFYSFTTLDSLDYSRSKESRRTEV